MNKEDTKITLVDDKGKKYTIIQTEKIDMEKDLNKIIARLLNNWNALKEQIEEFISNNRTEMVMTNSSIKSSLISAENDGFRKVLDKMQEIENKDFNDMTHMFDNATTIEPFLKEIESWKR